MVSLPEFQSYGNYSSMNYGVNCLRIDFGPITVWYSYKTAVAFQVLGNPKVVQKNYWGPTTGKHLNWIDDGDKRSRVSAEEFEKQWKKQITPALKRMGKAA